MFGLGTWEILILLFVVLLVFGASRLPSLGKGLGQGMRSFRDAIKGVDDDDDSPSDSESAKKTEINEGDSDGGTT